MQLEKYQGTAAIVLALTLTMSLFLLAMQGSDSFGNFQDTSESSSSIALVGVDSDQNSVIQSVPLEGFQQSLGTALSSVHDSLVPVLNQNRPTPTTPPSWSMRTVGVGVGVSAAVGLGPIWNVTVTPHIRLIFSNSSNPVYPD